MDRFFYFWPGGEIDRHLEIIIFLSIYLKMAKRIKDRITDEFFIKTCQESLTMAKAAAKLELHFNSFKKRALKLECYFTNQSGKGTLKERNKDKIPLLEILEGKHPYYQTNKLRKRLIEEGIKKLQCETCKIKEWNNMPISFELDHKDGNSRNHILLNLRILCPNCHSQTETYRSKNKKK